MKYTLIRSKEYEEWFSDETTKSKAQIESRLLNIELEGRFGMRKDLEDGVWELKWMGGRRIYYAIIPESNVLLLLGGNKNGQSKDINQAKKILKKYTQ